MPTESGFYIDYSERIKKTISYWMDKGCSEKKARELYFRYGFKKVK